MTGITVLGDRTQVLKNRQDILQLKCQAVVACRASMIPISETVAGVSFAVRVHPRAKKNAITGELGNALKLALTAPPVDGRANEACIAFFSKFLNVPRSCVSIASGENSRNKMIRITGLPVEEVRKRLARQVSAF